jgi:hypothetical protein
MGPALENCSCGAFRVYELTVLTDQNGGKHTLLNCDLTSCKCGAISSAKRGHYVAVGNMRHSPDSCWEACLCGGRGCNSCEPRGAY